jgi:hypothetical protein
MAQKGRVAKINLRNNYVAPTGGAVTVSRADDMTTTLRGLGYTGSLMDMRRKDWLTKLVLTEPALRTDADLEYAYLAVLGGTGSMADRRIQTGRVNFP